MKRYYAVLPAEQKKLVAQSDQEAIKQAEQLGAVSVMVEEVITLTRQVWSKGNPL